MAIANKWLNLSVWSLKKENFFPSLTLNALTIIYEAASLIIAFSPQQFVYALGNT